MQTTIVKWGNSHGIRLPKQLLDKANISNKDTIEMIAENNSIIIKKISFKKQFKTIQERFSGFSDNNEPFDIDWGKPVGKEIW